jgi:hypothetical protein
MVGSRPHRAFTFRALSKTCVHFRGRRVDLGIGTREMAAGVDVGHGRLLTIENGKATDEDKAFYRAWLSRIEGWSTAERHRQIRRINQGIRFRD